MATRQKAGWGFGSLDSRYPNGNTKVTYNRQINRTVDTGIRVGIGLGAVMIGASLLGGLIRR